jgi:hypothetical protein
MLGKFEKKTIFDTYNAILNDYFTQFLESDIYQYDQECINFDSQMSCNLFNGIFIINRVFEYVFLKTKSLHSTYYYAMKAISYYLEYLEQICKANLFYNLNHTDTILFVYKKTILDMFDNDQFSTTIETGGRSILSNIIKSNKDCDDIKHINNDEFTTFFSLIKKMINILLIWKDFTRQNFEDQEENRHMYETRIKFCQYFLENFLKNVEKMEWLIEPLEIMYQRLEINNILWKNILEELLLELGKRNKRKYNESINDFLLRFCFERTAIQEKLDNDESVFVVKWLLLQ